MKIEKLSLEREKKIQTTYNLDTLCSKILAALALDDDQIQEILYDQSNLQAVDVSFLKPVLDRFYQAKINKEKVLVCGDYDCDGICATTIMFDALCKYGINAGYYIPNRFEEGYGLHPKTVKKAKEKGYTLLVTVDNGVKALEALTLAKEYGMEVILSDHHHYVEEELLCDYFVHPQVLNSYFEAMCGAGIAYLLSYGLIGYYEPHVILAGIATIGDIVPLWKFNRVLVKKAVLLLNKNMYPAIQLLANDKNKWDATKIAFQIVPKLNCVGRLADRANVNTLVRYLTCDNSVQTQAMATTLHALNDDRKQISSDMEEIAVSLINEQDAFQIIYDERFHEGMNGIVASKLVSKLGQPTMVLSFDDGIVKGSIRSNSVDLTHFFDDMDHLLLSYGGHKQAAGIRFYKKDLEQIRNFANEKMQNVEIEEKISCIAIDKKDVSIQAIQALSKLEPFGCGFEMPLFYIEDYVDKIQSLSAGKHIKYHSQAIAYLYFNQGNRLSHDMENKIYTFIGKFQINTFRNQKSLQMLVDYLVE